MSFQLKKQENHSEDHQFLRASKPIDITLATVEFGAWKFLAITTAVLFYGLMDSFLQSHLNGLALQVGRSIGIFLFFLIIDFGIVPLFKFYLLETEKVKRYGNTNKAKTIFLNGILLLFIFRFVATNTSSLWASPELSKTLTSPANDAYYLNQAANRDSLQRIREVEVQEEIKRLENTAKSRRRLAMKNGKKHVQKAIQDGDFWQKKSFKELGFHWIEHKNNKDSKDEKYAKHIRKAIADSAQMVQVEEDLLIAAQNNLNQLRTDTSYSKATEDLIQLGKKEKIEYFETKAARTKYLYLLDIVAGLVGLLCSWMRVQRKIAGKQTPPQRNLSSTLSLSMANYWNSGLQRLEKLLAVNAEADPAKEQKAPSFRKVVVNPYGLNSLQHETTVSTTAETTPPTRDETAVLKQSQIVVPQHETPVSETTETVRETVKETVILDTPNVDISDLKKYAQTYYKRSVKPYKNEEQHATRLRNRNTYEEYRDLLIAAHVEFTEGREKLIFKNTKGGRS